MVQIITDSSALYTPGEGKKLGFEVLPLCVKIGDLDGRDLEIDMADFYARIERGELPTSSQPPIGEVMEVYKKYSDDEIIHITIADGLSGTYQSACGVVEMVENKDKITLFNCKTLCGPQRYMVEKVQKMKEAGSTAQEIREWLEYIIDKTESFLIPQDFDFLRRGGRLTPMAAKMGSVLKLKPIMILTEDGKRLDKFAIKRTMKGAIETVVAHLKESKLDKRHIVYVSHADAIEDAKKAIAMIREAFAEVEVQMLDLGAAFVTQGGPKCVAIQYIEK